MCCKQEVDQRADIGTQIFLGGKSVSDAFNAALFALGSLLLKMDVTWKGSSLIEFALDK